MERSTKRVIRKWITNQFLRFLEQAIKFTPRWLMDGFIKGLLYFVCLFAKKLRKICVKNLKSVYGARNNDDEYKAMSDQCIYNIGGGMTDLLYYVEHSKELLAKVEVKHEDNLIQALAKGQGVIAVSAHMGNFPLMFVSLVQKGYKVNVVIRPMRDQNFSQFMFNLCRKWGINMIQTSPSKTFLRESLSALKRNELLFILLDEYMDKKEGIPVKFFDRQVVRATGPMLFLERTGAPIVPIFIIKDEEKNFRIFVEQAFKLHTEGSKDDIIFKNISGLTTVIEEFVRRYPLQWGGWFNKRWAQANVI